MHTLRVAGSHLLISFGENAGRRMRRDSWWNGGSDVIGGAKPRGRVDPSGLNGLTITNSELKCSVSWAIAVTSAWFTGSHAPPKRSVWATGQPPRSSSQTSGAFAA